MKTVCSLLQRVNRASFFFGEFTFKKLDNSKKKKKNLFFFGLPQGILPKVINEMKT